ncbi:MAG: hypothetical protein CM15mP84_05040 [Cellvibrionales bacterium]|nr:MAG: hypothetical protein CM15mP84_05040 [Cellvibrionales bacterium]
MLGPGCGTHKPPPLAGPNPGTPPPRGGDHICSFAMDLPLIRQRLIPSENDRARLKPQLFSNPHGVVSATPCFILRDRGGGPQPPNSQNFGAPLAKGLGIKLRSLFGRRLNAPLAPPRGAKPGISHTPPGRAKTLTPRNEGVVGNGSPGARFVNVSERCLDMRPRGVVFLHHPTTPPLKPQCRAGGESGKIGDPRI